MAWSADICNILSIIWVVMGIGPAAKVGCCISQKSSAKIWETAGQERFHAVTSAYNCGAIGALTVYDITRRTMFNSVSRWPEELNSKYGLCFMLFKVIDLD
ncbi:hypothetical protein GIB67_002397 [Kingdonia uniflora]|uniref:Uncharacterized protein n=1 Tax=Kingdonia uniflora TaxID=39325 RepID=A0A7J7M8D0_9MAGN|nr:hypothetical protein GIB67_002397 [Kingdonia uniflora]